MTSVTNPSSLHVVHYLQWKEDSDPVADPEKDPLPTTRLVPYASKPSRSPTSPLKEKLQQAAAYVKERRKQRHRANNTKSRSPNQNKKTRRYQDTKSTASSQYKHQFDYIPFDAIPDVHQITQFPDDEDLTKDSIYHILTTDHRRLLKKTKDKRLSQLLYYPFVVIQ